MITTYLIEHIELNSVYGYFPRLWIAKEELNKLEEKEWRILAMRGPRVGEGYHMYEVTRQGNQFKRRFLR